MSKKLIIVPNQTLRKHSVDVRYDKKLLTLMKDLSDTLVEQDNPKGVGLSAPQIGKNWNVFATLLSPDVQKEASPKDVRIFINPKILSVSKEKTLGDDNGEPVLEGCLSIPMIYGPVPRHTWIETEFDVVENGMFKKRQERFTDFFARVFQHEYDHLRGVLFTDYSLEFDLPVYELRRGKMVEIDKSTIQIY